MRSNKVLNKFLQKNRFLYPGIVALMVASISYPNGLGKFIAGELSTHEQVSNLFTNFTWTEVNLNVEQAAIVAHWTNPYTNEVFTNLIIYLLYTSIKEDMMRPYLTDPCPEFEKYTRTVVKALWYTIPNLHHDSLIFMIKRAVEVPGYSYTLGCTSADDELSKKNFSRLSFYGKFLVVSEIIIYEHLCKFFIVRWLLNLLRACTGLLELYPLLPIINLGRKYAFVDIKVDITKKKN